MEEVETMEEEEEDEQLASREEEAARLPAVPLNEGQIWKERYFKHGKTKSRQPFSLLRS